ncbi:Uncharacterised protein, partial [Mycoplasmoides gallisepticum]
MFPGASAVLFSNLVLKTPILNALSLLTHVPLPPNRYTIPSLAYKPPKFVMYCIHGITNW